MLVLAGKMENEMMKIGLSRGIRKRDLHSGGNITNKHHDNLSTSRVGDQQDSMAVAAMLEGARKVFSEHEIEDRFFESEQRLERKEPRLNQISLGEQQHAMSLASWMVFQLESSWVYRCRSRENDVPAVMEDIPVRG